MNSCSETPPRLLLVAGAEQGGWVLATEGSLGVRAPDCTLGSPLSNPPDLQVGKGRDSPVRPELLWAPWSLKKLNKMSSLILYINHIIKKNIY